MGPAGISPAVEIIGKLTVSGEGVPSKHQATKGEDFQAHDYYTNCLWNSIEMKLEALLIVNQKFCAFGLPLANAESRLTIAHPQTK